MPAGSLFTRVDGRRVVTPLFLVFVAIGSTDLLFALDSIPAVFGVTQKPFIVFSANAFALLGLRALYFLSRACWPGWSTSRSGWRSSSPSSASS